MSMKLAAGRFEPVPPTNVTIVYQNDDNFFASADYLGVGVYLVHLNSDRKLIRRDQIIPTGSALGPGHIVSLTTNFNGTGSIAVTITDGAGVPVDDTFQLDVELINL